MVSSQASALEDLSSTGQISYSLETSTFLVHNGTELMPKLDLSVFLCHCETEEDFLVFRYLRN